MTTRPFTDVFPSNELVFHGPFDKSPLIFIKVKNTSVDEYVGFKVKTTAPTYYTVRPNKFYLQPGGVIDVQVTFNPRLKKGETFKPPQNHKFLIQAIKTTDNSQNISDYIVKNPENVHSYRMKCSFIENPEDANKQQQAATTNNQQRISEEVEPNRSNISLKDTSKFLSINNNDSSISTSSDQSSMTTTTPTTANAQTPPQGARNRITTRSMGGLRDETTRTLTATQQAASPQQTSSRFTNLIFNDRLLIYIFIMLVTIIVLVMSDGLPFAGYFSKE